MSMHPFTRYRQEIILDVKMYGRPNVVNVNSVIVPNLPAVSLDAGKLAQLARGLEGLTAAQLYWVAAWSATQAAQTHRGNPAAVAAMARAADRLTILHGSQTDSARRIAEELARRSEATGVPMRLLRADAYPQRELAQETHLLLVISTQGDGEPPDDARGLFDFITGNRAPKLPSLRWGWAIPATRSSASPAAGSTSGWPSWVPPVSRRWAKRTWSLEWWPRHGPSRPWSMRASR
jgi:hypothetical protein